MSVDLAAAEQALLGAVLIDGGAWAKVADVISAHDFHRPDHRLIFEALADLARVGTVQDIVTVSEQLESRGRLDEAGGIAYLGTLAKDTPTAENIEAYADIVRERSRLRRLATVGEGISTAIVNGGTSTEILAGVHDDLKILASEAMAIEEPIKMVAFDLDDILKQTPPERYLVTGVPCEAYTLIAGALSSYKSTLMLYLIILRATGYDFLNLDKSGIVGNIGPAVLIFYEDTDKRVLGKLHRILQSGHAQIKEVHGQRDADNFLRRATQNIRRICFTGCFRKTIVTRGGGGLIPNEPMINELLAKIRTFSNEDVLIGIDPLRLAIVGSQNDDDGADVVVHTLNRLAVAIPDSGIVVASHTTKAGAQDAAEGYAGKSYATSGSALYSQHARSNFHMSRIRPEEIAKLFSAADVPASEHARQPVAVLTHGRLSHGAESREVYFKMTTGGILVPLKQRELRSAAEISDGHLPLVVEVIDSIHANKRTASNAALGADERLLRGIGGRDKIREALRLLEGDGYIQFSGETRDRNCAVTEHARTALSRAKPRE